MKNKLDIPEKNVAKHLFETFCDTYNRRDLTALLSLFTKDADFWGTGEDEFLKGINQISEQMQRDWAQSEASEAFIDVFFPAPGFFNWTAAISRLKATINGKEHIWDNVRHTIVIEQEDGRWKIAHMHISVPDYRNKPESSFPI